MANSLKSRSHVFRMRRTSLLVAVALFASSCFLDDLFGPSTRSISGRVTMRDFDAYPGDPVNGVTVHLRGALDAITTTGADGTYEFRGVPNGLYQVTAEPDEGGVRPAGIVFEVENRDVTEWLDFTIEPGVAHSISGTVIGAAKGLVSIGWDHVAFTLLDEDGAFSFDRLRLGIHTVRPNAPGVTFTPSEVLVRPVIAFQHSQTGSGTLGTVTTTSITAAGVDVSGCFEVPVNPPDGVGTIRPRNAGELGGGLCPAYNSIWGSHATVIVTFDSALGPSEITLQLVWWHELSASSTSFTLTEMLVPTAPLTFTANPP